MLVDFSTKPPSILTTATYTDSLVKTKDGWRFTKRIDQGRCRAGGAERSRREPAAAKIVAWRTDLSARNFR